MTVRFGAGGEDGDPDPTDDYDGDDLGDIDLTINVTNVNEPGRVVHLAQLQPQIGTELTAIHYRPRQRGSGALLDRGSGPAQIQIP